MIVINLMIRKGLNGMNIDFREHLQECFFCLSVPSQASFVLHLLPGTPMPDCAGLEANGSIMFHPFCGIAGAGKCPFLVDFEHHLRISVGNYIPNNWVMFKSDIYRPLRHGPLPKR